jgi:raffinose/stachyose/melibiose transport system substrate-binding protein
MFRRLLPLDDAYASGNWDHIYPWTKERTNFGGKVYGIGNEIEFLGAYYNIDMFNELGLAVPTTYEEFLALCEALKAAGRIPIAFGDADGWPAFHMFSIWTNSIAGKEKMDELLFGGASWNDPVVVEAIQSFFVDMNQAGYLIPTPTAVNYNDSATLFTSGQAGIMLTGTWLISQVTEQAGFEAGWFFVPNPKGGDPLPPQVLARVTLSLPIASTPKKPLPS